MSNPRPKNPTPPNPTMITELGIERWCAGCREYWAADDTFWYMDRRGRPLGRCRACWSERITGDDGRRYFGHPTYAMEAAG